MAQIVILHESNDISRGTTLPTGIHHCVIPTLEVVYDILVYMEWHGVKVIEICDFKYVKFLIKKVK